MEDLILEDLQIRDFEVAGISINGFIDLNVNRVEIGPILTSVPLKGVYTQSRAMLPRLRAVADQNPEGVF